MEKTELGVPVMIWFIIILIVGGLWMKGLNSMINDGLASRKQRKEEEQRQEAQQAEYNSNLAVAQRNWEKRATELHIDLTAPIVWRPLRAPEGSGSGVTITIMKNGKEIETKRPGYDEYGYYPMHVWREGDTLCLFDGMPSKDDNRSLSVYLFPENIKEQRYSVDRIYRDATRKQCAVDTGDDGLLWLRLDAYETIHGLFPEK